jgi:hypothetical protein
MSQFCNQCNVQLEDTISHCPLCGKCINVEQINSVVKHEHFPNDKVFQSKKQKAFKALTCFLLLGNVISLFVELLLFQTVSWSLHILVASVFSYVGILRPLHQNWRLVNYHSIFYIMFALYILFLELYTNSFGWGFSYVIPLFALAFSLYNFILILSNIKHRFDYILPMLILLTISTVSFAINYVNSYTLWPSLSSFLTSISLTFISFIFHSNKILKALAKKFHI